MFDILETRTASVPFALFCFVNCLVSLFSFSFVSCKFRFAYFCAQPCRHGAQVKQSKEAGETKKATREPTLNARQESNA